MAEKVKALQVHSVQGGDLKTLREQVVGPVKIYLETGRHSDEDDTLVMEEYEDKDGEVKYRPELEEQPFLKQVWLRKNFATKNNREIEKKITDEEKVKEDEDGSSILGFRLAIASIVAMVSKWDFTNDGVPIPLTQQAIENADIPVEFIYRILNACYEYRRVPKELSDRSPSTSSHTE